MATVTTIGAVIVLGGVLLAVTGCKSVHAEAVIEAPPEVIWSVLTATASYAEWNPVLVPVEGELRPDAQVKYRMRDKSGKESEVTSTIVKVEPNRELNQFGGVRGIVTFDHQWILEPVDGGTRVIQHEEYRGIYVWFWDPSWYEMKYGEAIEALRRYIQAKR